MASDRYPYTTAPNKLREILKKAPDVGRPRKINREWLDAAGYTSSNDRSVVPVLKFASIIGPDNTPTETWDALRTPTKAGRAKVADAIRKAYADLFAMYPDAHRKDAEALRNFFRANTTAGEQVQTRMVQTFQTLVEFGDFDAEGPLSDQGGGDEKPQTQRESNGRGRAKSEVEVNPPPMTLTVNIQLQLPATAEADVYEKLFAAMRKHLVDLTQS